MPIRIPNELPAFSTLATENIFALKETRANHQDFRPLKIIILNLMPKKIETETQLLRLLSNTPIQVEIELLGLKSYTPKNTSSAHLSQFYRHFDDVKSQRFDGMIITGAPVERMRFEQVDYWDELCEIMDWSSTNVYSTMHICWAAQAGLYRRYNIDKYQLNKKIVGVFPHLVTDEHHPLLRGFDDCFWVPHSRYTSISVDDVKAEPNLRILSISPDSGIYIVEDKNRRNFYVTGHPEYDRDTLKQEYIRDLNSEPDAEIPKNYFPKDDKNETPLYIWRSHANLLYANWLNYFVYQETPFDLQDL